MDGSVVGQLSFRRSTSLRGTPISIHPTFVICFVPFDRLFSWFSRVDLLPHDPAPDPMRLCGALGWILETSSDALRVSMDRDLPWSGREKGPFYLETRGFFPPNLPLLLRPEFGTEGPTTPSFSSPLRLPSHPPIATGAGETGSHVVHDVIRWVMQVIPVHTIPFDPIGKANDPLLLGFEPKQGKETVENRTGTAIVARETPHRRDAEEIAWEWTRDGRRKRAGTWMSCPRMLRCVDDPPRNPRLVGAAGGRIRGLPMRRKWLVVPSAVWFADRPVAMSD